MSHLPHVNQPAYGQPGSYRQPGPYSRPSYGPPLQPYPQPTPYPQPYFQALPEHPEATTILVLGALGFIFFPCGIIAWSMGSKAMKAIQAGGIRYSNESNVNLGRILGMVTSIIGMVAVGLVLVQIVGSIVFWLIAMASLTTM